MMEKKVVIITGGSAGIGYAAAKLFLEKDCRVVILSTNEGLRAQERLSEFGEVTWKHCCVCRIMKSAEKW